MDNPSAGSAGVALAALLTITAVVLLAAMPSWAATGLAVAAAASWCFWLDRHPAS